MRRRYEVISIVRIAPDQWQCTYWVWLGCRGNRKKRAAIISQERRPLMGDIEKYDIKLPL